MRGAFSLKRLTAALLLVMTALLVSTGNASAHQGHSSAAPSHKHAAVKATADRQSVEQVVHEAALPAVLTVDARRGAGPCSDEGKAGHVAGCCTVACHGALTAPALLVAPFREPSTLAAGRPEQVLAGLSGDGNERPPKLG